MLKYWSALVIKYAGCVAVNCCEFSALGSGLSWDWARFLVGTAICSWSLCCWYFLVWVLTLESKLRQLGGAATCCGHLGCPDLLSHPGPQPCVHGIVLDYLKNTSTFNFLDKLHFCSSSSCFQYSPISILSWENPVKCLVFGGSQFWVFPRRILHSHWCL